MSDISESTKARYMLQAEQLCKRYTRNTGRDWRDNYVDFCLWLAGLQKTIRSNSWRLYRASVKYFMRQNGPEEVCDYLDSCGSQGCMKRGKSSSRKSRKLNRERFVQLIDVLSGSDNSKDGLIADLLVAILFTGLRPSELGKSKRYDRILFVRNGKYSEMRACGKYRRLHIELLPDDIIRTIDRVLCRTRYSRKTGASDKQMKSLRDRLLYFQKQLWPRRKTHISFYSARHQFCANHKAGGKSLIEIAALMGHAVDSTSTKHYRRASGGWKGIPLLDADVKNMALVRVSGKGTYASHQASKDRGPTMH